MADIGKLAIKLVADATSLRSGFDRALKEAEGFKKSMTSALNFATSMPGIGAGIAGFSGAIASALSVDSFKGSIDGIVTLQKEATKLGMTLKETSLLMTLEGPDFSAEEMLTGVRKLQESIADPSKRKIFEKHGLVPSELIGAGTIGSVKMFSDALERIGNSGQRLTFLKDIMGRMGHGLSDFLMKGGGNITDAMDEAGRKGQAVTNQMARDAKKVAAAWDDLGDAITTVKNKMAVKIAPDVAQFFKGGERIATGDVSMGQFARTAADRFNPNRIPGALRVGASEGPTDIFELLMGKKVGAIRDAIREKESEAPDSLRADKQNRALTTKFWIGTADTIDAVAKWWENQNAMVKTRKDELQQKFGVPLEKVQGFLKGASGGIDQFFRQGEGQLMRREEERLAKISDRAMDIFQGGATAALPAGALFGSAEAKQIIDQAANPAMSMADAVKAAFAEDAWQKSLAQKFGAEVAAQMNIPVGVIPGR